jgi:peptidoglycan/LPS O-acetylase OafA/YrhL
MYIVDGSFMALFLAGTLLCELDLLARNNNLPRFISRLEPYKTPIYYTLLVFSMFLSGVPSHSMDPKILALSPGWYYLSKLQPQAVFDYKWFYLWFAAVFLVSAIPRIRWLKSLFETRFSQYLGRISFSLYLVHGPLLWTLGDRLYVAAGWYREAHVDNMGWWINLFPLYQKGPLGLEPSFLLPHLILLPVNLWVAEIVTKLMDEPSVNFVQWLYKRSLEGSSEK